MNWSNIWELIKINILYTNPQAATALRNKQKKYPDKKISVYKKMMQQQLLGMVIFSFILLYLFIGIDYRVHTGLFSIQVAVFSLISIIQGFSTLFSVFYDSKDSDLYLPLPIKSQEVYLAKLLSSQGNSLMFLMPLFALFCIAFGQRFGFIIGILLAILLFFVLILLINSIAIILINLTGNILVESPYKKFISTTIMIVSTIISLTMVIMIQNVSAQITIENSTNLFPNIPYFRGFYDVVVNPFSFSSLINFWLGFVLLLGLMLYIKKNIIPNYIEQLKSIDLQKSSKTKKRKPKNVSDANILLLKHHFSTIINGTLIVQSFLIPILLPFSFLRPLFNYESAGYNLSFSLSYFGIAFLFGVILGNFTSSPSSFIGVAMSLERENFHFIKTLPLSFSFFLKQKFYSLLLLQLSIPLIVYTIVAFVFLHIPIMLYLFFLMGLLLSSYLSSEWLYQRDYKLLSLNWQNITQLFSRGRGKWLTVGIIFGNFILGAVLIMAEVHFSRIYDPLAISIINMIVIMPLLLFLHLRIKKRFWNQLP
ncbi:ABC transporter permease [Streptococcus pacificus]|uniref:ABC transporter permease n=1 Tax=Streptococcus pacificus TaxID=2740577 RepID=A0ABS0ZHL8_9STRE|nr:ABC transporter permease [Streptococcus pacificus]MBJ8325493.1 ABC transporter permease [Streptococcus pacificus]